MKRRESFSLLWSCIILCFLIIRTLYTVSILCSCTEQIDAVFVEYSSSGKVRQIKRCYVYTYDGVTYHQRTANTIGFDRSKDEGCSYPIYINPNRPLICKDIEGVIDSSVCWNGILFVLLGFCVVVLFKADCFKSVKKHRRKIRKKL